MKNSVIPENKNLSKVDNNTEQNNKESIKVILKKSDIKNISPENLSNHVNCHILSSKLAKIDKETIILYIELKNINDCSIEKWKSINKAATITVDKHSKHIKTLCIDKISINESTLILTDAKKDLLLLNKNIFNIPLKI